MSACPWPCCSPGTTPCVGLDIDAARIERLQPGREPDPRRGHLALPRRGGARPHLHDRRGGGPRRRRLRDHRDADQLRRVTNYFDTSTVEHVMRDVHRIKPERHDGREVDRAGGLHRGRARAPRRSTTSSSPPSSCARARRCTTTCTRRGSWSARTPSGPARFADLLVQGRRRRRRTRALHRAHRGRGDQALRQHLPRDAGGLLQRARLLRDLARPRQPRRSSTASASTRGSARHYNNPSFGYGGYCLPEGHQAAARQLLRRTADADLRDRRRQHHAQGLHRLRHPRPRTQRSSASTG